jgi:hypothetical protein
MTSFNNEAKKQFSNLQDINVFNFMVSDLHPYYLTLFLDCIGIVVVIVVASILLRLSTVVEHEAEFKF